MMSKHFGPTTRAILVLAANTSFADFPRLCRMLAHDGFLPLHRFMRWLVDDC